MHLWEGWVGGMHTKIGGLGNNNSDVDENSKKAVGLNWQNNNPACASPYLAQFSLLSLHDYDMKMPNFPFFASRIWTQDSTFLFLLSNFDIMF